MGDEAPDWFHRALADRPAEATTIYLATVRAVRDETGVDPGPALREAYREVVGHRSSGPAGPPGPLPARRPVKAGRDDVTAAELAGERWIVGEGLRSDPHFGAWPTLTDPVVVHSAPSLSTRLGLVAAGLGVALIPSLAAASVPPGVDVVSITDTTWTGRRSVALVRDGDDEASSTVVEALAACAADRSLAWVSK